MTDFVGLIVDVHDHLDRADLPHAFGGALALGYIAEPRGTVDIDVNVFVPEDQLDRIAAALEPLGYRPAEEGEQLPVAGVRFTHDEEPFPLDVFPSLDDRYATVARRTVHHPFGRGDDVLPFLGAEDLSVFKLSFGRPQDWVDLSNIAAVRPDLDLAYVEDQLVGLRGRSMYPRAGAFPRVLPRHRVRAHVRSTGLEHESRGCQPHPTTPDSALGAGGPGTEDGPIGQERQRRRPVRFESTPGAHWSERDPIAVGSWPDRSF